MAASMADDSAGKASILFIIVVASIYLSVSGCTPFNCLNALRLFMSFSFWLLAFVFVFIFGVFWRR